MVLVLMWVSDIRVLLVFIKNSGQNKWTKWKTKLEHSNISIETKKCKLTITISATHYKLPQRMVACHVDINVTTSAMTRAGPDHSCLSSVTSVSVGWCPAGKHKQTEVWWAEVGGHTRGGWPHSATLTSHIRASPVTPHWDTPTTQVLSLRLGVWFNVCFTQTLHSMFNWIF